MRNGNGDGDLFTSLVVEVSEVVEGAGPATALPLVIPAICDASPTKPDWQPGQPRTADLPSHIHPTARN